METILFFEKMQYNYSFALSDSIICIRLNMESLNNPGPFYSMIIPNTMRSNCQRGFTWIKTPQKFVKTAFYNYNP